MHTDQKTAEWWQAEHDASPKGGQQFFSWSGAQKSQITKNLNENLDFNETLEINGDLSGQVTLSGNGVDGADVIVYDLSDGTFLGSTTTDPNGNYSFSELAPNDRYLVAAHYFDTGTSTRYADAKTEKPTT